MSSSTKLLRLDPTLLASNPRATLSAWQRYEPLVLAAHSQHPQTFSYECTDMASNTICSRIRDAIRGALAFSYPSTLAHADLLSWYSEVIIRFDATHVHIGPRGPLTPTLSILKPKDSTTLEYARLTNDELHAFALLLSSGRLQGPILCHHPNLTSPLLHPNLEVIHREDGAMVLI